MFLDPATNELSTYGFSTVSSIKNSQTSLLPSVTVSSTSRDTNVDSINDQVNITARILKPQSSFLLQELTLIAALNYTTEGSLDLTMETLATASIQVGSTGLAVGRVSLYGSLDLRQLSPVDATLGDTLREYDDDFFDNLQFMSSGLFLESYLQRNLTTKYNFYETIQYSAPRQAFIDVKMQIVVPTHQSIQYIPDLFETLKFSWVQYFSLFIPVYLIVYYFFFGYIVENNGLNTVIKSELQNRKFGKRI